MALAAQGARLILADINEQAVRQARTEVSELSECLLARAVDLSKRDEIAALAAEVHELVPTSIDVLVNCAGVYMTGSLMDLSLDDWDWVLSVNLRGTVYCCHHFVPRMVARGKGGHVVNLASMYGFWPSPRVAGYLTSKFAVYGFSEALREDLRDHGIGVSTVCPGVIRTGLVKNMRIRNNSDPRAVRSHLEQAYQRRNYGPEKVADAVVSAVKRKRKVVLVTPEARVMYYVERFCPALSRIIARVSARRMFDVPPTGQHQDERFDANAPEKAPMRPAERDDG